MAVLLAAPFRPPLDFSGSNRFFVAVAEDGRLGRLLPLYFVLAAAGLALGWRTLRGAEVRELPRVLALPAAAFLGFAFLSLLWADDLEAGANMLTFFTLPFAALLAVVARAEFPDWAPRVLAICAIALASVFAAVGVWQAITHKLFFYAPNLAVSNANTDFFRVTSLFGDPSLYGRHVVLGIGIVLTLLATGRARDLTLLAALALMWAGLFFSYSQSSMTALLLVTLALAFATGDRPVRRAVGLLALGAAVAALGFGAVKVIGGESVNRVTSDRTERVEDALRVIREDPVQGVGIGGQPRASRLARRQRPADRELRVAHHPAHRHGRARGDRAPALPLAALRRGPRDLRGLALRARARPGAGRVAARPVRARPLLQRLPRGPAHVVRARGGRGLAHAAGARGGRARRARPCPGGARPR